ncbi:cyclopropane-fatty-acyl-phospholipid synthase family protein [Ferrimonas pelagia]|uniref:Cyclopropane-fatty-acyl-phospholipid synthase family protein n=1 Tax=Ferrimonas pelagia TaxID=1177826 RepID=A0ABP9FBV1_9GAMM
MISSEATQLSAPSRWSDKAARSLVLSVMGQLRSGGLILTEPDGTRHEFGTLDGTLTGQVVVHHAGFFQRVLRGGSIAAGESYMDGWWDSPDLTQVVRVLAANLAVLDQLEARVGWAVKLKDQLTHRFRRNHQRQAQQNIAAHYDLGNELYRRFLDHNMLYSSALYVSGDEDLAQAQINKMDRLCQLLRLQPEDHLLEIGTGWGAMAIHAAQHYGCRVTTTTISKEQHAWAKDKIAQAGLSDRITLLLQDYRDLTGHYDKLVSVEMIEAVGKEYLDTYVAKCQSLLKPEGLMALQSITIADQRDASYSRGVDFIQKYIFPGGFLPSLTRLNRTLTQHSDFVVRDLRDMGMDYAQTLRDWHQGFNHSVEELKTLGYDERFIRMWRYYLSYCEGGFAERTVSAVQLLLSRPGWRS